MLYRGTTITGGCPYCGCTCSRTCTVTFSTNIPYTYFDEIEEVAVLPSWLAEQRQPPQRAPLVAWSVMAHQRPRRHIKPPSFVRRPTAAHRMGLRDARP